MLLPCKSTAFAIGLGGLLAAGATAQTVAAGTPIVVFSAIVGGPNPPAQTVSITNPGAVPLAWRINNRSQLAAWLTGTPHSGRAPGALAIAVDITGFRKGSYHDTLDVASNDPTTPIQRIVVRLTLTDLGPLGSVARYLATYQIELEHIGISGHHLHTAADCQAPVNPLGYDLLVGTVVGVERPAPDEDVVYTGTLRRVTAMDFCELKGPVDQSVDCRVTLDG